MAIQCDIHKNFGSFRLDLTLDAANELSPKSWTL